MALTLDEEYDLLAGAKQIDQEAANQLSIDREYDMLVSGGNKDYVASKDIQRIPQQINALGGLPVGGEPMVGGPDILAQEQGQTKTFMEGPDGKPVEVRRAQAIDISGKVIPEPISPDGMDLQFRGDLIKQKTDELKSTFKLPFKEYRQKSDLLRSDIQTLKQKQQEHESKQIDWLTKLVTEKSGVSVPIETGIGQEYALDETKGKTQEVPIGTRKTKAEQIIRDKNLMIDDIIGNDKFINYALDKNLIAPQFAKYLSGTERLAGKLLNEGESADVIESLKRDPKIRELAEQWALTTPTFMQSAGSIFQNAWDSYSQTLGSSNVGAVGLALESLGATQLGKSLVEAADYADQQRKSGQDPRKANAYIEFAKDVTGGIGSSAAFLVTGVLGRSMMSTLGVTSERAVNLLTKGNILTFGGLSSAWQGYSEARNDGATDEQAKQVALFSAMTQAPLELLSPLEKWIGKLDNNSKSRIYKGLSKAAEAIIDGADEALFNEAPQQIAGNLVKKYVYNPNQDIFDGAGYSATTGGAAGVMTSILVNMISGKRNKAAQKTGNPTEIEKQDIETQSDQAAEELSVNPVSDAAARMTKIDQQRSDLQEQISSDEELLQQYEEGSEDRKIAERAINQKRIDLENLNKQFDEAANGTPSKPAQVSETITPTNTKESIQTRIEELNKEFDALDEVDIKGQDRVNQAIFAEQNKLAELTAIEQGVEPQGTTPTREMGLPPSGRRSAFGTFFPDRPVLQAFVKATDKVIGGINVTGKRAQKLKNAIRTGIANNAGFLAGTNTEVISSEEYGKLTGTKQVAADTGTYRAVFFNGKKYLVLPNINELTGTTIQGEQRAASKDAALDQEARAAVKKLEEEVIHLSMFQGIQDEYKALKKPKFSEQEYIVKRISDIAKEVKRTNPNALPGVSNAYLTDKTKLLDDMTFSQEFMRMVIQRVRTGQITEDLNAIRQAEQEAFSDQDKGAIISLKNSILNALKFVRNSIARYLGKGTSTKEVKRMEDTINNILDEYGIVKGEANYEFKDYSAAQPKGEVKAQPTEPTVKESLQVEPAVSETITPPIEARAASYVQDIEVFDRNGENKSDKQIVVTANSPQEAAQLVRNTPEYQNLSQKSKAKKLKFFTIGEPRLKRGAGESGISARAGVSPKMDAEHLAAVESGDMETAQRMVDEASGNKETVYRGQKGYQTKYPKSTKGFFGFGKNIKATFFSSSPYLATDYSRGGEYKGETTPSSKAQLGIKAWRYTQTLDTYSGNKKIGKRKFTNVTTNESIIDDLKKEGAIVEEIKQYPSTPTVQSAKLFFKNPLVVDAKGSLWNKINFNNTIMSSDEIVKYAFDNGYDGVEIQNVKDSFSGLRADDITNDYISFYPEQVKSADPVTYDEAGNVIPLSQRFDVTSPIIARAGVSPKPSSKISKIEREVTQQVINDIESMINDLDTGKDTSGKAYESKTAQKGKKYAYSLVSPFSQAINLFTTTTHKESLNAFNKVLKGNPDASFFDIASNLTLRDVNGQMVVTYGLTPTELSNLIPLLRVVAPTYRQMIMDSDASFADRTRIALNMPAIEYGLSKATAVLMQTAGRVLNAAKQMRQFGGYGFAVANYKSKVVESIGGLWSKVGGDMADVAEAVRGDRRKAVDNVFNLSRMISKAVSLQKMAVRNPEKARQSIRNAISRKQNRKTKEILLEFCANTFGEETEKYANMIIDQTAQAILAIGSGKKNISTDATYKKIYNAISSVAKQTAQEEQKKQEGNKKREVKPREGKFLQQVGMVIGNDKTYKQFIDELKKSIRREYQSDAAFNNDYKTLFDMLSTRQWSDNMRTQAIKDSADALNYKFADLFTYIGSKRTGAQADVKAHITSELKDTGASQEMIDKFISDVDSYLNDETMRVLEKKLGFQIDEKTNKITGGQVIKENMRALATAEGQFKFAKTLKGLTRLAASDQRNFLDKLNELIITELGFDEATSNELSKYIDDEISKAIVQQQSDNLKQALDRATKTLENNNIKRVGTQRTLLKRLIEMANMGQLDDMKVYEAFRQTHNFSKGYLEYNPEFVQTLREWGDRISSLPEGVLRGIEEQKLGRYMLEKGVFTTTDYLSSYWYFSLLSQTGTQAMNVLGSTFNLLGNMAVWATYTKGKSVFPMMKALSRAITGKQSPASNAFLYVMQTGLNPSGLQDEKMMIQPKGNLFENATPDNTPKLVYNLITFGGGNVKAITPALNSILNNISPRAMMRFMKATDAYMREVAYEVRAASLGASEFSQEQFDAAMRQAEKDMQGSKSNPKEKKRETIIRANEIIANQRLEAVKREFAEQDALEVVYSQKPAGFIGWLASIANKALEVYPVTRLFIPFTNVCANVLNENLNYAPLISQYRLISAVKLSPLLKGKIELRSGAEKNPFVQGRSEKAAEIAIKSSIGLVASALPFIVSALAGGDDEDQEKERPFIQFYSQGPKDPEQNKIWSENGGIKYSIRVGNTYISYLYTPLVIPLSYGQMLKESADEIKKKAGKDKAGDISELMIKALAAAPAIGFVAALDQSFLTGVSDLIELKEAKDIPKAGAGIVRNIVSRMITPGVARDMQKLMIDEKLEGDLYITNMLKEFPGSSAFLDKDLNYFGDPARYNSIMQENGFTRRAFSLIGRITSSENPDPAFEILYKNGITPPKWNQSLQWFDKTPMNKAEQREFVRAAGPLMRQFIIDNEPTIEQIQDTETAQKFISNGISAIRAGVKGQLQAERQ